MYEACSRENAAAVEIENDRSSCMLETYPTGGVSDCFADDDRCCGCLVAMPGERDVIELARDPAVLPPEIPAKHLTNTAHFCRPETRATSARDAGPFPYLVAVMYQIPPGSSGSLLENIWWRRVKIRFCLCTENGARQQVKWGEMQKTHGCPALEGTSARRSWPGDGEPIVVGRQVLMDEKSGIGGVMARQYLTVDSADYGRRCNDRRGARSDSGLPGEMYPASPAPESVDAEHNWQTRARTKLPTLNTDRPSILRLLHSSEMAHRKIISNYSGSTASRPSGVSTQISESQGNRSQPIGVGVTVIQARDVPHIKTT
ncbi:hypothetical protein H4582DRAFT_2131223, partial [Lactarius indigo]